MVAAALAVISLGLLWLSRMPVSADFGHALPGLLLLGAGAGLAIAPATASVIGSLPPQRAGVGSATNGTALQTGGALGVAVLGATLAARYQAGWRRSWPVTPFLPPPLTRSPVRSAERSVSPDKSADRPACCWQMRAAPHLAMTVAAIVVASGAALVLAALPSRATRT